MESGYTYLQARYYDSELGRFISEDPALDGNNWYVYCGNDPVNMIDPTGMWSGSVHKEMTEWAYNKLKKVLKHKKGALNQLKSGSTYPDRARSYKNVSNEKINEYYKDGRWHGHDGYRGVMQKQLNKAREAWKKRNYEQAYFEIGKGLHTIQDFYAHNVMKNGTPKTSRRVADGTFYVSRPGNVTIFVATKHNEYLSQEFIKLCGTKIKYGTNVHSVTADNPNAYFNGKKWVWTSVRSNKRYQDAKKESRNYLKQFMNVRNNKKEVTKKEISYLKIRI